MSTWRYRVVVVVCGLFHCHWFDGRSSLFADDIHQTLTKAQEAAQQIHTFELNFTRTSTLGGRSVTQLWVHGAKFRGEHNDITADRYSANSPGVPGKQRWAFNGVQFQQLDLIHSDIPTLFLADGGAVVNRQFGTSVPIVSAYCWLQPPDQPCRWDTLMADDNWDKVRADGMPIESRTLLGHEAIGFEAPQLNPGGPVCRWRVWLAPTLGYAPLLIERIMEGTRQISTTTTVHAYQLVETSSGPYGFPLDVSLSENGEDKRSMVMSCELKTAPGSLRVNHEIPEGTFTLAPEPGWRVYDTSAMNRSNDAAAANLANLGPPVELPNASAAYWSIVVPMVLAVCGLFSAYALVRRRKGAP